MMGRGRTLLLALTALTALGTFMLGLHASGKEREMRALAAAIADHRAAIEILEIELIHRSRPQKLQQLNDEFLALEPVSPEQVAPDLGSALDGRTPSLAPGAGRPRDVAGATAGMEGPSL